MFYRVAQAQAAIVSLGALVAAGVWGLFAGGSVFWGGVGALMNLALLVWRMVSGRPTDTAGQHLWVMYRSSMERFFVVMIWLATGIWLLHLLPVAVLMGFLAGQLVLVVVLILRGIEVK